MTRDKEEETSFSGGRKNSRWGEKESERENRKGNSDSRGKEEDSSSETSKTQKNWSKDTNLTNEKSQKETLQGGDGKKGNSEPEGANQTLWKKEDITKTSSNTLEKTTPLIRKPSNTIEAKKGKRNALNQKKGKP